MNRLRLHLIACRVFERELEVVAATAKTELRVQYLEIALHEKPGEQLRSALQQAIVAVTSHDADVVALGYGLCNRGLVGLRAQGLPVVIPRAHDCLGLLLGSSKRYLTELEQEPGTYFQSCGWVEHLPADRTIRPLAAGGEMNVKREEFVAKFGEEAAQFLMEEYARFTQHYKRLAFISTPVAKVDERERKAGEIASLQGWKFEKLPGDLGWLRRLVDGEWDAKEFLVLPLHQRVALSYGDGLITGEPV